MWPFCLAGAGLGLQLHDLLRGTDHHAVFDGWWNDTCRTKYLHLDGDELPQMATLYYDPILDVHHEVPVAFGMIPAIYLAPQVPEEARRLFQAGLTQMGQWETTGPGGGARAARLRAQPLAREGVGPRVVGGAARRRGGRDVRADVGHHAR